MQGWKKTVAVLGKNIWGAWPHWEAIMAKRNSIEPIKNLGAWARFGRLCPLAPT